MTRGALFAAALLVLVALEILPCTYQEAPTAEFGVPGGFACRFEPLQVCDQGDFFLGIMANAPFVVAGNPVFIFSPELRRHIPESSSFVPDGFEPVIDHPPQLSA